MNGHDSRHSADTPTPGAVQPQALATRHRDKDTFCHPWPRLLSVDQAAAYLSLSKWTVFELVRAGDLRAIQPPRPQTARAMKTKPIGETMRRKLYDRHDLDALADAWKGSR